MIFYFSFLAALGLFTTLIKSKLRLGKAWFSWNPTNKCGDLELMNHDVLFLLNRFPFLGNLIGGIVHAVNITFNPFY